MSVGVDVIMGVDPGISGALCILVGGSPSVFDTPTNKVVKGTGKKKRNVNVHNIEAMRDMLRPFAGQNVTFALEKVSARPGEGVVSSFNFGQAYAFWKMAAVCFEFDLIEITPTTWKKTYPQLSHTDEMDNLRDEIKALRAKAKVMKDNDKKETIKEDVSSMNRKLKTIMKDASRALASEFYPSMAGNLKLKKHDGRAESILIARYAQQVGKQ